MRDRFRWTLGVLGALVALPASAHAQAPPAVEVRAQGNPLYDSANLRFSPPHVSAAVGQFVRWTNTDAFAPHTATEVNGLWDLGGAYGATPASPSGFAPGASVSRQFEAGRHLYLCRVHPSMRGSVSVPVGLSVTRRNVTQTTRLRVRIPGRRRPVRVRVRVTRAVSDVTMTWAPGPTGGEVRFDVEVRRGEGPYVRYATGTRAASGRLVAQRPGTLFHIRARLRAREGGATDWSPLASITS